MQQKKQTTSKVEKNKADNEPLDSPDSKQIEASLREYQAILSAAEEVAKIGSWKWDLSTQKVTWSDEMFRLFGVEREGFDGDLNRVIAERIHPDDLAAVNEANRRVLEEAVPSPLSYRIVLPNGTERTVWAQGKMVRDANGQPQALTGFVQDITERVVAEKKILQMKRLYATLSQINQMIVRVKKREELFQTICDVGVKFGEFTLAWVGLLDDETGDLRPMAANGLDVRQWPFPLVNINKAENENSLAIRAIRTSQVMVSEHIEGDERVQTMYHTFQEHSYQTLAVVPFQLRGKAIGILSLISEEKGLFQDEEEIRLLDEMGLDISFALDNLENEKERKQAEQQLRESEERYRLISENSADVIWVLDPITGRFSYVSPSVKKLRGYTPAEVMAQPVSEALTPESFQLVTDGLARSLPAFIAKGSGTESYVNEVDQPRKDGSIVHTEVTTTYMFNQQGQVEILGITRDITERRKAEQALHESEYRYRSLVETSPDGIFINRENQIVFMNSRGLKMLGATTPEQVLGRSPFEIFHPDSHSMIQERIKLLLNEGVPVPAVEEQLIRLDGTILSAEVTAAPVMVDGVRAIQVVLRDITERKRAEEQVKQNERVLRLFVEHSPASIAMFDREMRYIVASHRYLIDYRLGIQELTGRSHYDIFPEMPERWKEIHRRGLNGEIIKADEDPFPREDGTMDWVRWEIHPWYEETGSIGGIILFSEVITERKQVQDELHLLNLQLEQRVMQRTLELSKANRAKDEFLANMSHELRTPLNTVLGLSESLLEQRRGPLNEKQAQSIELIASSGRHLLGLINDILEVSKIEAGKLELHPTRVYIKELCESSLNFIKEIAFKKRIHVEFNQEESLSTMFADPQRLKQILINLLTNAVKFTTNGGRISLDVYTNADRDRIMFSVSDTGIGIADQDLKKLFTPFTQLDSSLSRQYAGTGLGLALVQKLTDLQGGSVEVESELGKGSRFTIILPLKQAQDESMAQGPASRPKMETESTTVNNTNQPPVTVLLAEDNEINAQMIAEYLEAHNYKVFVSGDGEAVLQKARETSPHIILMDIQMPKMDGLEAIRHLRTDARFASTPIIALTALAMPGDRERCLQAGANEYLSKPVSLKKLVEIIQSLTG